MSDSLRTPATDLVGQSLSGVRILVVEDDPAGARLIYVVLSNAGAEVKVASSAENALSVVDTFRPALLLVDVILPMMTGLELAEKLRHRIEQDGLVVVLFSSGHDPILERRISDSGYAYFRKPIATSTIAASLAQLLDGRA